MSTGKNKKPSPKGNGCGGVKACLNDTLQNSRPLRANTIGQLGGVGVSCQVGKAAQEDNNAHDNTHSKG